MKRRIIFLSAVLLAMTAGFLYWNKGAQTRRWVELVKERKKIVFTRSLVSLEGFISRRSGWANLTFGYLYGGFRDNVAYVEGSLLIQEALAGQVVSHFYYHDWDKAPSSQEVRFTIDPAHLAKFGDREMQSLIARTRREGEVRTTFCGMEWFSYFDDKGFLDLTLRLAYPSKWMDDVPDYDRGFSDEMYFDVSRRAIRYLSQEVLQDPYTRIELALPMFNPPTSIWDHPVGGVTGLVFPKKGDPIRLEIGATYTTRWPHDVTVDIEIRQRNGLKWPEEQAKQLFKPEFLASAGKELPDSSWSRAEMMGDSFDVLISLPLEALDKYAPKR